MNVFVLRHWDGLAPSRVELVILAQNRYEAEEKANQHREGMDAPLIDEEDISDLGDAFESEYAENVFVV